MEPATDAEKLQTKDKITLAFSVIALLVSLTSLSETVWNVHDQEKKSAYFKLKAAVAVFKPALWDAQTSRQGLIAGHLSKDDIEMLERRRDDGDRRIADDTKDLASALAEVAATFHDDTRVLALAQAAFETLASPNLKYGIASGPVPWRWVDPVGDFVHQIDTVLEGLETQLAIPKAMVDTKDVYPSAIKSSELLDEIQVTCRAKGGKACWFDADGGVHVMLAWPRDGGVDSSTH